MYVKQIPLSQILVLLVLASSIGCASKQVGTHSAELTVQQEQAMRRHLLPKVRSDYHAVQSPEMQIYIQNLGNKLTKANDLQGKPFDYTFTVVDSPSVNAFSLPAGSIFVTKALLTFVETEAELAAVLSHELGHVIAHHAAKRLNEKKTAESDSWAYAAGGAVAGGLGTSFVCQGQSVCSDGLMSVAVGGGLAGGLLLQKYAVLGNRQEDELEADRLAYGITRKAGFSVRQLADFYSRLQKKFEESIKKKSDPASLLDSVSTHPSSAAREKQIRELAKSAGDTDGGIVTTDEFKNMKKYLLLSPN